MNTLTHLTLVSSNAKTGPIPVSTSSMATCPRTCGLNGMGCYADNGPLALHWRKVTLSQRGDSWPKFLEKIRSLPANQLWRHNQAGDLAPIGGEIDFGKLLSLCWANKGRRGFTYTHYVPEGRNLESIRSANVFGFTVNVSADNLKMADKYFSKGLPTVTLLPRSMATQKGTTTPSGNRVVVCPAVRVDGVTCASCGLCQRANRQYIIGFPVHGSRSREAERVAIGQ